MMQTLSVNEAGSQFGELLTKAQLEPVQINKNGKAVAVLVSVEEHEHTEALKLSSLQDRAAKCEDDFKNGNTIDGESFFEALTSGSYD